MMNNTVYGQMQMDVMNTANNMVIQQVCADKGIDYNQVMYHAQQQHLNNIMMNAQHRMMMKEVKRHYQGDTFMGKVRDLFGGNDSANMMNPMMFPGFIPQQPMMQPMYQPQPQPVASMPAVEVPLSTPETARIDAMEKEMSDIKQMLAELANQLSK